MAEPTQSESVGPDLGRLATVIFESESHDVNTLADEREGLREITVFPGPSEDFYVDGAVKDGTPNEVLALDSSKMDEPLVDEIHVVSTYTLHVALYALQNPTPENIRKALTKIGTSGDCDEWANVDDPDDFAPLPVAEPSGWERDF